MILDQYKPGIEKSDTFEEKFFSIGDYGMVFDILRSKMYSDPITSICREITCNARDSHREAKKFDEPITIVLPNDLEPFFKVKDVGVGISPDRIENIFIKFGASTKRDSNEQTGAFGIGAKVPFSYSDSFNVETNYDGVHYNYTCYIDETKVGKCALLSKEETKEPNGTTIIIPVKKPDFHLFKSGIEAATRHWEVKPIIKGAKIDYEKIVSILSGNGWSITERYDAYSSAKVAFVIDGIEYPIDVAQLRTFVDYPVFDDLAGKLYLYFKTGDISISTNREQVHIDKKTKDKTNERLNQIKNEFKSHIVNKLVELPNLSKVYSFIAHEIDSIFINKSFLFPFDWHGITIDKARPDFTKHATIKTFYSNARTTRRSASYSSFSLHVNFNDANKIIVNDIGEVPETKHVKSIFAENASIANVQVISPNGAISYEDMVKELHLDKFDFALLSSIPIKETKARASSGEKILIFKYNYSSFSLSSRAEYKADIGKKVIVKVSRDPFTSRRYSSVSNSIFTQLKKDNYSIWGVDSNVSEDKIKKDFPNHITIEEYTKEKTKDMTLDDMLKIVNAYNLQYSVSQTHLQDLKPLLTDKDGDFYKFILSIEEMSELVYQNWKIDFYEAVNGPLETNFEQYRVDHPELDYKQLQDKICKTYPLYNTINHYGYNGDNKAMAHYINLIDKENKEKAK